MVKLFWFSCIKYIIRWKRIEYELTAKFYRLEKLVSIMLFGKPKADPNATVAKNALPGTVPGSTPPVLLAATRGYYKV